MESWAETITPPPDRVIRRMHRNWEKFVNVGEGIASTILSEIRQRVPKQKKPHTLEFGCGYGRVFLPMHFSGELNLYGCDVNEDAVRYLRTVVKPPRVRRTEYNPPLHYPDGFFDCVYSVSIWTHLPLNLQIPWLREIARVLRPGGVALITTSGYKALASRRRRSKGWEAVSDDDLREAGIIYREYDDFDALPGITESYGLTALEPGYIRREWNEVMKVLDVKESVIGGFQDLVTMVRTAPGPSARPARKTRALPPKPTTDWHKTIERPPAKDLRRHGKTWTNAVRGGTQIAETILTEIKQHLPMERKPRTLEFGCGFGRVYLPVHFSGAVKLLGCDINPDAVKYMHRVVPPSQVRRTDYLPPLPYKDGLFDCVYSISVWTQLPPKLEMPWLQEIARILRPGGLALITTAGFAALASRRGRSESWRDESDADLREAGILYAEYENAPEVAKMFPGVTDSYGLTAHDPAYVRREWQKAMDVLDVKEGVIGPGGFQDLVIMWRRSTGAAEGQ